MIKFETIGMIERSVQKPDLTASKEVSNYEFITYDGDLYLVANTLAGDDSYVDDVTFKAGDYLNGYLVKAWESQKLVVDEKHISYASGKKYSDLAVGNILTVSNGKLAVASVAPESGVYFKITDKCRLTGKAIKVKVYIA